MSNLDTSAHIYHAPELQGVVKRALTFFEASPVYDLRSLSRFLGVGVYGLYYHGDFSLYRQLAQKSVSLQIPIYAGKAVPTGWRSGRSSAVSEPKLYHRLIEHRRSISAAENLNVSDFSCRFIILENLESDLIVPVESELIRRSQPLWNTVVEGFGNHDPGKGRYNQAASEWDVVHPGRQWVQKLSGTIPEIARVQAKIADYMATLS